MTSKSDLFLAVTAMDSYNHGDLPSLDLKDVALGNATFGTTQSDAAKSFSATSYRWTHDGKTTTVISYRGTDDPIGLESGKLLGDILNGWTVGAGLVFNNQASLAIDFYRKAMNVSAIDVFAPPPGDVVFTGHSLGGGLAGYVASLSHKNAVVFDHMPFEVAAVSTFAQEVIKRIAKSTPAAAIFDVVADTVEERVTQLQAYIASKSSNLGAAIAILVPKFTQAIQLIDEPPAPDWSKVYGIHVEGEALGYVRALTGLSGLLGQAVTYTILGALHLLPEGTDIDPIGDSVTVPAGALGLDMVQLHSQALQVLLMYAQGVEGGAQAHNLWRASSIASTATAQALFDNEVGKAAGFEKGGTGAADPRDQMAMAIAYSVLDSGKLAFGDTAARAFFDDADDLGSALSQAAPNENLSKLAPSTAKIFTQFSALLATRGVVHDQGFPVASPLNGVLSIQSDINSISGSYLKIDLSDPLWTVNPGAATSASSPIGPQSGRPDKIQGVKEMVDTLAGDPKAGLVADQTQRAEWLWGADYVKGIDKISIAIGSDVQELTQSDRPDGYHVGKIALFASGDASDKITGSVDDDLVAGGGGNDTLKGGEGRDMLVGGSGNDTLLGGLGNDVLVGGDGSDTVDYGLDKPAEGVLLRLDTMAEGFEFSSVTLKDLADNSVDRLFEIEKVKLTDKDDVVVVAGGYKPPEEKIALDGWEGADTLDLHEFSTGLILENQSFRPVGYSPGSSYDAFKYLNFNNLILTKQRDIFNDWKFQGRVDLGDGDDILWNVGWGTEIVTGKGKDIIGVSLGSIVVDMSAEDTIIGNGFDVRGGLRNFFSETVYALGKGALRYVFNEVGDLLIDFAGKKEEGSKSTFFLANWKASQGTVGGGLFTGFGGITVAEFKISAFRLFENFSGAGTYDGTWELFGLISKIAVGKDYWTGKDPLVIDLDGDGFDLLPQTGQSPMFDTDADGYAEHSAWVGSDDGFLVRDLNGDGQINDSREMFGGRGSGFELLATLDGDHNGVVNAADNGLADFNGDGVINAADQFSAIKIWNDRDGDGKVDQGEFKTLSDFNIVGLSVITTSSTQVVAGSAIAATANFVRTDGTTGLVGEALFQLNNSATKYIGPQITVSAGAALRPDLKGFGTLVSLRQALSVEASGLTLVDQTLASLNAETGHDLASIRQSLRPLLKAWAEGSPIRLGDGNLVHGAAGVAQYANIPLVRNGQAIADYAWRVTDEAKTIDGAAKHVGTWEFATGLKVTMILAAGATIPDLADTYAVLGQSTGMTTATVTVEGVQMVQTTYSFANGAKLVSEIAANSGAQPPTLAALLSGSVQVNGSTYTADETLGSDLAFFERYLGALLPLHDKPLNLAKALEMVQTAIANMETGLNLIGARVAMQSAAFSDVFEGLRYDAEANTFKATTDQMLAPTFGNLMTLASAKTDPVAWMLTWKPLMDLIIADYDRGSGLMNTNGFLAQNVIAAWELADPSFPFLDAVRGIGMATDLFVLGAGEMLGGASHDIFYLDGTDQTAKGGAGVDNYIVGEHLGHDVIDDLEAALTPQSEDVVRFTTLKSSDISATRDGLDLVLTVTATGETLRIKEQFYGEWFGPMGGGYWPDRGVAQIVFANGEVWDEYDIAYKVSRVDAASTTVIGTADNDVLEGGAGNDRLEGAGDSDVYIFGRGDGSDIINDIEDNDYRQSIDRIEFKSGVTREDLSFIREADSDDLTIVLNNGGGSIKIEKQLAATYTGVFGVWWINRIETFLFDDHSMMGWDELFDIILDQYQTDGDDLVYGFDREDVLDGGAGNDFMSGGNENDIYRFGIGSGHDVIHDREDNIIAGEDDTLQFKAGVAVSDVAFTRQGDDLIVNILSSGDFVRIKEHFVVTETGPFGTRAFNRMERFVFSDGTVKTWQQIELNILQSQMTTGADHVIGSHYDDYIEGLTGDDLLEGGSGSDTYVFGLGDGHDTVDDVYSSLLSDGEDTIVFKSGINPNDIVIERFGPSLFDIRLIYSANDSITLPGQFFYTSINVSPRLIEHYRFADGTVWTPEDVRLRYLAQIQTAGDDVIEGFWTADTIEGGTGNDILRGGDGSDTYILNAGFGQDEIQETVSIFGIADEDQIKFGAGLFSTDAKLTRLGDSLKITFTSTGDSVLLKNQFLRMAYFDAWSDIELISFADGGVWTADYLRGFVIGQAQTPGDDHVVGFNVAEFFDAGTGDDLIEGFGGGDTFVFGRGYGQDRIAANIGSIYDDKPDTVVFKADIAPADVKFIKAGRDLRIEIAGVSDTLTVLNHFDDTDFNIVERFVFHDGTVITAAQIEPIAFANAKTAGADLIVGNKRDNLLDGGAGDDRLQGGNGNDTYVFDVGYGRDVVADSDDNPQGADKIAFGPGVTPATIAVERVGDNLVFKIAGHPGDTLTIENHYRLAYYHIEQFVFSDGTVWGDADITLKLYGVANPILGTRGDDTLVGTSGDDVIVTLDGLDTATGGDGSDTYIVGPYMKTIVETAADGDQDVVKMALVASSQASVSRSGDDALITFSGGSVRLSGQFAATAIEKVEFNDGVVWTAENMRTLYLTGAATSGADTIVGFDGRDDTLAGGAGNDILNGKTGGDSYLVGGVNSGKETIRDLGDQASVDRLVLAAGIAATDVTFALNSPATNDLTLKIGAIEVVLEGELGSDGSGVEQVVFADGTTWDRATLIAKANASAVSDQTITGTTGADTLTGGAGNDTLIGLEGDDTYLYNAGGGTDIIDDKEWGGYADKLVFGTGLTFDKVQVARDAPTGTTMILSFTGQAGSVRINGTWASYARGVEQYVFAEGVTKDASQLAALFLSRAGTANADTIYGFAGADTVNGGGGNDVLRGLGGDDTYVYNAGDGDDVIYEEEWGGYADKLVFGTGLSFDKVQLTRTTPTGTTLALSFQGYTGSVTVDGAWGSYAKGIDQYVFADGVTKTASQLAVAWLSQAGTSGADTIYGFGEADTLEGKGGNDSLYGGNGDDIYLYNAGDGVDTIYDSEFAGGGDKLVFGAGLTFDKVQLARNAPNGAGLTISFQGYAGSVTVDGVWSGYAKGVEQYVFGDGVTKTAEQLAAVMLSQAATSGNDTIYGFGGADSLSGGAGDDSLFGQAGDDTYFYGVGDGNDTITEIEWGGNDKLVFGAGLSSTIVDVTRSGATLTLKFAGQAGSVTVLNAENSFGGGLEQFVFADNVTWTRQQVLDSAWRRGGTGNDTLNGGNGVDHIDGGAGNDILWGGDSNDVLIGGTGNDELTGAAGGDSFIFKAGFGADLIWDFNPNAADEVIEFGDNLFADFADLLAHTQQVGGDVVITHAANETLTLKNVQLANLHQDDFRFVA